MELSTVPFQFEDRKLALQLLENVKELIKDSDAAAEKEIVKSFLQRVAEDLTFMVIGDAGTGKSSFLNRLFAGCIYRETTPDSTRGIREIRCGVQETEFTVARDYIRYFRTNSQLEGIRIVDTQGLDTLEDTETREYIKKLVLQSDVLFVMFDALHIKSYSVWEFLEETNARKVVFVMSKCDLAEDEILQKNKIKLQQYIQDAGLEAPLFLISEDSVSGIGDKENMEALIAHIHENVLGKNPVLERERKNIKELKTMLTELKQSFTLRKQQYESDVAILREISNSMDAFVLRNETVVNRLKTELTQIIHKEIDRYSQEMISRMDPMKIKERCPGGAADVERYLAAVNENYKNLMNNQISGKTQEAVRLYLSDLQNVFEEATGFFRKRQSLIAMEDKFYGSMAVMKKEMIHTAEVSILDLNQFYEKLVQASEELFLEAWKAREQYDVKQMKAEKRGAIAGGVPGLILYGANIAAAGFGAAAAKTSVAAAVAGAATTIWPVVLAIVGAVLISKIAKRMAAVADSKDMYEAYQESVREFKEAVKQTRDEMTEQILQTVTEIFNRELHSADNSFAEFRMTVNIDSKNIPQLEAKLGDVGDLLQQLDNLSKMREREAHPVV